MTVRWNGRGLVRVGLLLVLGPCAASALIEHVLELRDAARLTANDTFYAVGKRRIRYHRTGPSAPGPTVVLLNGMMASLEQWDAVQTALSTVGPVVSYDRGGNGFSDSADAHGANADADELNHLLHAPDITGPFVLVSFSSSSMLAIVFANGHPDIVKGLVFIDPTVRAGSKTYRRIYWRPAVINPLEAFFGYTRLKLAIETRNAPPPSAALERSNAVVVSTRHWLASSEDVMSLDESAAEAVAALATHPFADLPLGVLTTANPAESEYLRVYFERHKELASSSDRGILRAVHGDHSQLLDDRIMVGSIVDLIRTITDEARARGLEGTDAPVATNGNPDPVGPTK